MKKLTKKERKALKRLKQFQPLVYMGKVSTRSYDDNSGCMQVHTSDHYQNNIYDVFVSGQPKSHRHILVKRRDNRPSRDWRHFQRIKNETVGEESEAVELYPAESRLVDATNQFHLWVMPEGAWVPVGFDNGRNVTNDAYLPKNKQRPYRVNPEDNQLIMPQDDGSFKVIKPNYPEDKIRKVII